MFVWFFVWGGEGCEVFCQNISSGAPDLKKLALSGGGGGGGGVVWGTHVRLFLTLP